jgi:Zinc dependent phospholipase C
LHLVVFLTLFFAVAAPHESAAYSVLSHEANVDALWDANIRPLLAARFPAATREQLRDARAYAYGGSVIQDLGYYPFGSHFFSNLLHYVRSGEFVEALIRESRDVNEYAFALGALAHYAADNVGHPDGVNVSVALMFPKLREKYGRAVTYEQSPASHVLVEFSFDVVQAAGGAYVSETYQNFVGFQVATPVLERAFFATYGIKVKDVFADEDLAIGTYRHAVSEMIPEITRMAWRDKRDEIEKLTPGVTVERAVFNLSRHDYERAYGTQYKKPGLFARFFALLYKLLPKIGPLRPLKFQVPTPEAERLFLDSFTRTRERYRSELQSINRARLDLPNTDFDTGKPSARGEYRLADDTYAELLDRLEHAEFAGVSNGLRENIVAFYATPPPSSGGWKAHRREQKIERELADLRAAHVK